MRAKDKKFQYYGGLLINLIVRGIQEKNKISGGLPRKGGFDYKFKGLGEKEGVVFLMGGGGS